MKEVRIVSDEELKRRKATNLKILKFGCLPIIVIFLIVMVVGSLSNSRVEIDATGEVFNAERDVKNFCLLPIEELAVKYGQPTESDFNGDKDYTWTLNKEKGLKAIVFIENGETSIVRFNNIQLGDLFWEDLGWDKNNFDFNNVGKYTTVSDLSGIEEAMYKNNSNVLNIKLKKERNSETFGKKE